MEPKSSKRTPEKPKKKKAPAQKRLASEPKTAKTKVVKDRAVEGQRHTGAHPASTPLLSRTPSPKRGQGKKRSLSPREQHRKHSSISVERTSEKKKQVTPIPMSSAKKRRRDTPEKDLPVPAPYHSGPGAKGLKGHVRSSSIGSSQRSHSSERRRKESLSPRRKDSFGHRRPLSPQRREEFDRYGEKYPKPRDKYPPGRLTDYMFNCFMVSYSVHRV